MFAGPVLLNEVVNFVEIYTTVGDESQAASTPSWQG